MAMRLEARSNRIARSGCSRVAGVNIVADRTRNGGPTDDYAAQLTPGK